MPQFIPCPLCGQRPYGALWKEDPPLIVRCLACGFIYVNPQPTREELERIYAGYYGSQAADLEGALDFRLPVFRRGMAVLEELAEPGGRLLDVGCGTGGFLRLAQQSGWDVVGVELSSRAAIHARDGGLPVQTGTLVDQRFPDHHFDVVTLWDVLEHLPDPRKEVAEVHRILKVGGVVIIRVPNTRFQLIKERLKRVLGSSAVMLQADLHLNHFTPPTLRLLLKTVGFDVFREEVGVAENYIFSEGIPLWVKRYCCAFAKVINTVTSFQIGPTMVQYGRKIDRQPGAAGA